MPLKPEEVTLFGNENTVFPPALKGHNWNTINLNVKSTVLQKGTLSDFKWGIQAVDGALRKRMSFQSRCEDAREFAQFYTPMRQFIDDNLQSPLTSRWSMS